MTVSASGWQAETSAAIVSMVARSTSFRTACGAANETAARAFIVEASDGNLEGSTGYASDGSEIDRTIFRALVHGVEVAQDSRQIHSGTAVILLTMPDDATDDDDPAGRKRRISSIAGDIVDDLEAQHGTSGALVFATYQIGQPVQTDETSAAAGFHEIAITLSWSEIP